MTFHLFFRPKHGLHMNRMARWLIITPSLMKTPPRCSLWSPWQRFVGKDLFKASLRCLRHGHLTSDLTEREESEKKVIAHNCWLHPPFCIHFSLAHTCRIRLIILLLLARVVSCMHIIKRFEHLDLRDELLFRIVISCYSKMSSFFWWINNRDRHWRWMQNDDNFDDMEIVYIHTDFNLDYRGWKWRKKSHFYNIAGQKFKYFKKYRYMYLNKYHFSVDIGDFQPLWQPPKNCHTATASFFLVGNFRKFRPVKKCVCGPGQLLL